jgi:hypothetical protein
MITSKQGKAFAQKFRQPFKIQSLEVITPTNSQTTGCDSSFQRQTHQKTNTYPPSKTKSPLQVQRASLKKLSR